MEGTLRMIRLLVLGTLLLTSPHCNGILMKRLVAGSISPRSSYPGNVKQVEEECEDSRAEPDADFQEGEPLP
jgi:hypothetical protein